MDFDNINTIKVKNEAILKEKGSEFIAIAAPCLTTLEFENFYKAVQRQYFDATHHTYAYKLKDGLSKYSDNGEPNGTAGIRILNAIEHFKLTDLLVIVVRYFGGTKLGVGPLGKAYYTSAFNSLENAQIVIRRPFHKLFVETNISNISPLFNLCDHFNCLITKQDYLNGIGIECLIPANDVNKFQEELISITSDNYMLDIVTKQPEYL